MRTSRDKDIPDVIARPLLRLSEALRKRDPKAAIYLCGSYAKGDWLKDSDIDLMVVSRIFSGLDAGGRFRLIKELMGHGHSLDLLAYTPSEFERAIKRSMIVEDMLTHAVEL